MKRIALLLATTALVAGLAGAAEAKTLVYCSEGSPEGFDPGPFTSGTTMDASSQALYNRVVEFEHGTTKVVPGLAESWEVSPDGLTYTFKIRPGVKFHTTDYFTPTRDLNADDIVFTFAAAAQQGRSLVRLRRRQLGIFQRHVDAGHPEVDREGRRHDGEARRSIVRTPRSSPTSRWISALSSRRNTPTSSLPTAHASCSVSSRSAPALTSIVDYQKDAVIRYKANPDYWRGKPMIDDLIFAITTDNGVRWQKLKAGECHVMPYPNPADIQAMKEEPGITVMEQEGLNIGYLAYNTQMKPFDDPKVRKALNMAIDKQAIIDAVFQGTGKIAKNPIPPTMWSYDESTVDDPYDPEAAKKMLADAGVSGLKMKIWAMPVQRPYNPNARRMAELIQADFAAIGVEAEIVSMEWGEYLKQSSALDRDGAVLLGWTGDNGDPDNFLAVLLGCDGVGGNNRALWCYQPFEDLIQKAKGTSDQEARADLYEQAQKIFKDQAPWATIAHSLQTVPMSSKVSGFVQDPLGHFNFEKVDIAE